MAKSRKSQTLIEVINKAQSPRKNQPKTDVPPWFGHDAATPQTEATSAQPATTTTKPPSGPSDTIPPRRSAPFFQIDGPRVVFTLSSLTAAIALFAAGAALIAAYELGKDRGDEVGHKRGFHEGQAFIRKSTADEIESARKSLPNPDVLSGLGSTPVKSPSPTEKRGIPATGRSDHDFPVVRNHTYIVVQDFLTADLNDARHAKDFLAENDIESKILESSGKYGYRLVATKGFNCDDPNQRRWCDKYHQRISALGKKFRKAGGRYDLQGYKRKATGESW